MPGPKRRRTTLPRGRRAPAPRRDRAPPRLASTIVELLDGWNAASASAPILPSARRLRALAPRFRAPLPWRPETAGRVRADLNALLELCRRHDSPRFWGYVTPPGNEVGAWADLLASGINQNLTTFRSAPGATLVELQVIEWIREIVGLPRSASGLLTSGGSMANLAGLAAARATAVRYDLSRKGLRGAPGAPLTLYASEEVHHSVLKAASILGLGSDHVRLLPVDRRQRMALPALRDAVLRDRREGLSPFCVVASAGTVATGAVDPLRDIWRLCRRERLFLHVDACYGGFAIMAPTARPLLRALSLADSVALDPHKWLNAPLDAGCILYRDPGVARRAFHMEADYTRLFGTSRLERFSFGDYGPELSRRFRALKIWLAFKHQGGGSFATAIERCLTLARLLETKVREGPRLELLARGDLSIVCFRYVPRGPRRKEAELEQINQEILVASQRSGRAFVSNARVRGRFALRACLLNERTTPADLDAALENISGIGDALTAR